MTTEALAGQALGPATGNDHEPHTPPRGENRPSAEPDTMSAALITSNVPAIVRVNSVPLERSLANAAGELTGDGDVDEDDNDVASHAPPGDKQLSDEVICLREWGTRDGYPLRTPRDSRRGSPPSLALQLARADVSIAPNRVELVYEGHSWRVKDWDGITGLKQDGRPTREATLAPGAEITIAGRTLIAESPRSIALRNFCARLIGWGDERLAAMLVT